MSTTTTASTEHQHHEWCDTSECYLGNDEESDYASHFGRVASPTIDVTDCLPWRGRRARDRGPSDPIHRIQDGRRRLNCYDVRNTTSTSGSVGVSWLTPAEARELADILRAAADAAETAANAR